MAIQMRRGAYVDFDPSRMLPGEWAVVLSGADTQSGYAVYICYAAGVVRRLVSEEEISALPDNVYTEVIAEIQTYLDSLGDATADAESAATSARASAASATSAASSANSAADSAVKAIAQAQADQQQAADDLNAALDALGDISEVAVPLMSETTRGGAKLGSGLKVDDGKLSLGDVVTDSHDGPIYSVGAEGWSEQETTTGKNLLKPRPYSNTVNGITVTAYDDGSIALRGTATADSDYVIETLNVNEFIVVAGDYTFSVAGLVDGLKFIVSGSNQNGYPYRELTSAAPSATGTVTDGTKPFNYIQTRVLSGKTVNTVIYPQLEAGSTATSYEPYTGTKPSPSPDYPQEIRVARGRNLLDFEGFLKSRNVPYTKSGDVYTITALGNGYSQPLVICDDSQAMTVTMAIANLTSGNAGIDIGEYRNGTWTNVYVLRSASIKRTDTFNAIRLNWSNPGTFTITAPQIELGSTFTPYVPYGHVGLEVRDSGDALVSCTPIPLPSKGWAGGLPDGTADALAIDSAGRWEWTCPTNEIVYDGVANRFGNTAASTGSNTGYRTASVLQVQDALISTQAVDAVKVESTHFSANVNTLTSSRWAVGDCCLYNGFFYCITALQTMGELNTWLQSNPVTVLYLLATPTTEHGYIDLPDVPEGSTIDIPELREVGVKCFVPGARELAEHANNWGNRCKENESRIAALEAAVATLATQ